MGELRMSDIGLIFQLRAGHITETVSIKVNI